MTRGSGAESKMQLVVQGAQLRREQLQAVFNEYDTDGSGAVSTAEMVSILQSLGVTKTDEEIEKLMKDSDLDGIAEPTTLKPCSNHDFRFLLLAPKVHVGSLPSCEGMRAIGSKLSSAALL